MEKYTEHEMLSKREATDIMINRRRFRVPSVLEMASIFSRALISEEWDDGSWEGFKCFCSRNDYFYEEIEEYEIVDSLIKLAEKMEAKY